MALRRTDITPRRESQLAPATPPAGYGPADLQQAYDLAAAAAADGAGETVALVDAYDDPNAETDLATYRAEFGLPACTSANGCFRKLNQHGQPSPLPSSNADWGTEESLDLDMVSAVCPNCQLVLVEADFPDSEDLGAAEDAAVAAGAGYVSNSWGGPEYAAETADDSFFNHPGVALVAASGDDGYEPGWPAATSLVTSVGGTSLVRDDSARGFSETVWAGTGSGCSAYESKPGWQSDTGCSKRTMNDVAAVADPETGLAVYDTFGGAGGWGVYGGTSAASPIIAAVYALAGRPDPGSNPASYPYADPSGLYDVTSGNDGNCSPAYLCTARTGYDGPTGLGTPDGVRSFAAPRRSTTTTLRSSANPANVGESVTFTATVNTTAGDTPPTGTVTFRDGTTPLGEPVNLDAAQATLTTDSLAVGQHSITATYNGDNDYAASTSDALAQVMVAPPAATHLLATPVLLGGVTATLTRTDTGAPLPGQTITFTTTSGSRICVAQTNDSGTASCPSLQARLLAILGLGYAAHFDGTDRYQPANATGALL